VGALAMGGNGDCYYQPMVKPRKKNSALVIKASVWLKDEGRFALLENLDHIHALAKIS
jgi:hypothetical protein